MKRKFVLAVLPALMVLSACGVKPATNNKVFLEDTNAHSEIFGNEDVLGGKLGIKARAAGEAISEPKIGYQLQYDNSTSTLAIRFVAAIKEFNVKAYWRRGVAAPDGTVPNSKDFSDEGQQASNYYLSLGDGASVITAGQGDYADYAGFVVYTIRNIPYEANKDSYVAAYVNLVGGEEGEDVHKNSKALAVKIELKAGSNVQSNNAFAFDPTVSGHFLEGTINGTLFDGGTNGLYRESSNVSSGNYAWYEHINLKSSDSFGSFYYDHDRIFQFFGYSDYFDHVASYFDQSSQSGYVSPKNDGKYTLYVSSGSGNENHIYADKYYYVDFYVDTTTLDNWSPAAYGYFVHAYDGNVIYTGEWGNAKMSLVSGEEHLYFYELEMVDGKVINNVIFSFYQSGENKQSVSISCSISSTGAYDITYDDGSWTDGKMSASLSAR